jgi:hypothetical protein
MQMREICFTAGRHRRGHRYEDISVIDDGRGLVGGEYELPRGDTFYEQIGEARLVERRLTGLKLRNLAMIDVE